MKEKKIVFKNSKITMEYFDSNDLSKMKSIYHKWKELNKEINSLNSRKMNIPEIVSEGIFCCNFNCGRTNGKNNGSADAFDENAGEFIQIKATCMEKDLTSFGPNSTWDKLYLMDFDIKNDKIKIYLIPNDLVYNCKINENETFQQQQQQKRRPRFSIKKKIIEPQKIEPIQIINL